MSGMKSLRNDSCRMEIGYRWVSNNCMLFVRNGNVMRYFATFPNEEKAKDFLQKLKTWDEYGGNDE